MERLKDKVDRFYLDIIISELRFANTSTINHLTHNSLLYLDIINYTENCTVSYIAHALHVAKSAVTLKVKELEKLGLVEKIQSKEDKRVFYLKVNETLVEEYKEYDRILYKALDEIEEIYSPEDVRMFCGMLDVINRHFEEETV